MRLLQPSPVAPMVVNMPTIESLSERQHHFHQHFEICERKAQSRLVQVGEMANVKPFIWNTL